MSAKEERLQILKQISQVERNCISCKRCPVGGRGAQKNYRHNWCAKNCNVPGQLEILGKQFDETLRAERAERAVRRVRRAQKRPDAPTSDLSVAAL